MLLGLGFVTSITFIFLVGVFMSSWVGESLLSLGEWFIRKMPLVIYIYSASKQISAAISPGDYFLVSQSTSIYSITYHKTITCLSMCFRSKVSCLQRGCHHKASASRRVCIRVYHIHCDSAGHFWL